MITLRGNQKGLTLMELLLVLVIAVSFLTLGLRQYRSFRVDADILQLKKNIDTLFLAATNYYWANCSAGNALDAINASNSEKIININTDLIQGGYLSSSFPTANPLVNSSGINKGYYVQFNKYTTIRYQTVCSNPPTCSSTTQKQLGTVLLWRIQVSVLMKNVSPIALSNAKNYLSADCLGVGVARCSAGIPGNYVVFERMPSYGTSNWNAQSTFWLSNPVVRQFNQMYTNTGLPAGLINGTKQYFYCSG